MEFQVCTIGCTPTSPNTKYFMRVGDPLVQERNLQEDPSHRLEVCRGNLHLIKRQMSQVLLKAKSEIEGIIISRNILLWNTEVVERTLKNNAVHCTICFENNNTFIILKGDDNHCSI